MSRQVSSLNTSDSHGTGLSVSNNAYCHVTLTVTVTVTDRAMTVAVSRRMTRRLGDSTSKWLTQEVTGRSPLPTYSIAPPLEKKPGQCGTLTVCTW